MVFIFSAKDDNKVILSPRLKTIADSIHGFDYVADIGTDHAYVPIYLIQSKRCIRAIATDVNKGPVKIAGDRIKTQNLGSFIETRRGDGLAPIKAGEAEAIVIAGMGGALISEILEQGKTVAKASRLLVLQPQSESDKVRRWLLSNGFEITDEELVKDEGIIYEIIWAVPVLTSKSPEGYLLIGEKVINKKHPLLKEYIENRTRELHKVLSLLQDKDTPNSMNRKAECHALLEYYKEVLECLLSNVKP